MRDHNPQNTDWLALAKRICQPPLVEPYRPGDRVLELDWPDTVLTVTTCINGYVTAERREPGPDGRKVFAFATSAPAREFALFARAGDNRPEPERKVVKMSAAGRLQASKDGHISKAEYRAAYAEDDRRHAAEKAAALLATDGERVMRAAAE